MKPRLHHIGIVVADLAQACETYVSRLGYAVRSEVIHDPVQTAFVQFFQGESPGPLVELVTPDGPKSKLAGALERGGGLNHLCYLTDAIERDCKELRAQQMFLLQAPVPATAFPGRRIAWLMGKDGIPIELVEEGPGI